MKLSADMKIFTSILRTFVLGLTHSRNVGRVCANECLRRRVLGEIIDLLVLGAPEISQNLLHPYSVG